jgi:hypothetical protein
MLSYGIKRVMAQNSTRALLRSRGTVLRSAVPMVNQRTFSDKQSTPEPAGGNNMMMFLGLGALVGGGVLMSQMGGSSAEAKSGHYTTESTAKLPAWIQAGLGDTPFYSEEKNATFGGKEGITPQTMPDISKHANFMTDFLKKNPAVYD